MEVKLCEEGKGIAEENAAEDYNGGYAYPLPDAGSVWHRGSGGRAKPIIPLAGEIVIEGCHRVDKAKVQKHHPYCGGRAYH